jgi:hypothetical protein
MLTQVDEVLQQDPAVHCAKALDDVDIFPSADELISPTSGLTPTEQKHLDQVTRFELVSTRVTQALSECCGMGSSIAHRQAQSRNNFEDAAPVVCCRSCAL